jgi:nucleotide-binding universal stress UspA family protein
LSPAWNEIAACGREFCGLGASRAILTHVMPPGYSPSAETEAWVEAESYLKVQARQLEAAGLEVVLETPSGSPGQSLNQTAQRHDASLIVLGTHGKSLWREGVLGSFSSATLHQALFPILLLPVRIAKNNSSHCLWQCDELLRHVLFPTDFSEIAAEALVALELLASRGVTRVTLLHALEIELNELFAPSLHVASEAPEYNSLEILKNRLEAAGVPQVQTMVIPGHPYSVILDVVRIQNISLIVMGAQGRGFLEELFLGSVAHNISREAPCPILLIPWLKR